jgi:hypothetical protein
MEACFDTFASGGERSVSENVVEDLPKPQKVEKKAKPQELTFGGHFNKTDAEAWITFASHYLTGAGKSNAYYANTVAEKTRDVADLLLQDFRQRAGRDPMKGAYL